MSGPTSAVEGGSLFAATLALAPISHAAVAAVRRHPDDPAARTGLQDVITATAELRRQADVAAADKHARARARRASLTPASTPWAVQKAFEMEQGAADLARLATAIAACEADFELLAQIAASCDPTAN